MLQSLHHCHQFPNIPEAYSLEIIYLILLNTNNFRKVENKMKMIQLLTERKMEKDKLKVDFSLLLDKTDFKGKTIKRNIT